MTDEDREDSKNDGDARTITRIKTIITAIIM